jgi:threonylcarbamoyladenosine tRNA methylthiotransferase MtaB
VINTCTVTAAAAADSRQKIRQAASAGQVVVTGCWSTMHPQEAATLPRVSRVVPNELKDRLVVDLLPADPIDQEPVDREFIPGARFRTRAFIKVQDGCDNRCTFCVTTLARGQGRSRSIADILQEINQIVAQPGGDKRASGAQEIVLTGVHLGSWGHDLHPRQNLEQLVRAILGESALPRLRLSSLEPWDLTDEFFSLWQDPRLCRQLHLPLQSGCASTLRRMARKTTPQAFTRLVDAARQAIPGVAITTDIIVGFPGEDESEFAESLEFVRQVGFSGGHVFTYSPRAGTAAARMPGQVPLPLRKERNARMQAVLAESAAAYRQEHLGMILPVLWESAVALGADGWQLSGLTDNYLRVRAQAPRSHWNQITTVRLERLVGDHLQGVLAAP